MGKYVRKKPYDKYLPGERYGRLTIIEEVPREERKDIKYREVLCQCDCGNKKRIRAYNLRSGNSMSCGCLERELIHDRRKKLIGERFGRLTVIEEIEPVRKIVRRFKCRCDCGNERTAQMTDLTRGMIRSCGCLRKEVTTERLLKDITGKTFNELTAIRRVKGIQWLFKCSCGREVISNKQNVIRGLAKSCGHMGKSSAEYEINQWLMSHNIKFDHEATIDELRNPETSRKLVFDFKIFRNDGSFFLLEHQGIQHFKETKYNANFGKQQREVTDKLKKDYCKTHGITLHETFYNEDYIARLKEIIEYEIDKEGDVYESEVMTG